MSPSLRTKPYSDGISFSPVSTLSMSTIIDSDRVLEVEAIVPILVILTRVRSASDMYPPAEARAPIRVGFERKEYTPGERPDPITVIRITLVSLSVTEIIGFLK